MRRCLPPRRSPAPAAPEAKPRIRRSDSVMSDWGDSFDEDEAARERERRRAEREARRRQRAERRSESRGALADRVRGLLRGDDSTPEATATQGPPASPVGEPPLATPPTPSAPPRPPEPPREPGDVHWRRRFAAIGVLLVAVVALVVIALAL